MPGGYEYHDIYYISMVVAESNKYPKILIFLHMAPHRGEAKKLQHKTNMGKNTRWNWVMLA